MTKEYTHISLGMDTELRLLPCQFSNCGGRSIAKIASASCLSSICRKDECAKHGETETSGQSPNIVLVIEQPQ